MLHIYATVYGAGFPWYGVKVALLARTTIGPFRVEHIR